MSRQQRRHDRPNLQRQDRTVSPWSDTQLPPRRPARTDNPKHVGRIPAVQLLNAILGTDTGNSANDLMRRPVQ